MSSLNIILIDFLGWQKTFYVIAIFGISAGILVIIFVREPIRGQYNPIN